jgi:hypothetical protein
MNDHAPAETAAAGGGLMTRWVELVTALLIVLGGSIVIKDSLRIGAKWASDGPEAGYFPFLTGCALVLSGAWIAGTAIWNWKKQAGDVFVSRAALKPVLSMLLPTIVYVAVIKVLGLYLASAIFIAGFMLWQGRYKWLPTLSVSIGVPVVTFLLFEIWFLVPLPKGPVERLLGY